MKHKQTSQKEEDNFSHIIEGRLLREKSKYEKYPDMDWIKIASLKLSTEIKELNERVRQQAKKDDTEIGDRIYNEILHFIDGYNFDAHTKSFAKNMVLKYNQELKSSLQDKEKKE